MKRINSKKIIIFHIGGVGDFGPIEQILNSKFSHNIVLVLFEARGEKEEELSVHKKHSENGVETYIVPYCINDKIGTTNFYINKTVMSSSIFPPEEDASKMHLESYPGEIRTWRDNTILDRETYVDAITLDEAIAKFNFPKPDVISIDAQGAELRILRSALSALESHTTCIVTEVEFREIYSGQDLFNEQFCFLKNHNFCLVDIINTQYWHPEMTFGMGFLTVGEAIFFKDQNKLSVFLTEDGVFRLIKYACISFCFRRYSMCYYIISFLLDSEYKNKTINILLKNKIYNIIYELYEHILKGKEKYYSDKETFRKYIVSEHKIIKVENGLSETYRDLFENILTSTQLDISTGIVIYGAGEVGEVALEVAVKRNLQVKCFVDRNKLLWGTKIKGIPVFPLDSVLSKFPKVPFLIGSVKFVDEIISTIKKVQSNRILSIRDI